MYNLAEFKRWLEENPNYKEKVNLATVQNFWGEIKQGLKVFDSETEAILQEWKAEVDERERERARRSYDL